VAPLIYFDTHAVVALYKDFDLLGEKARRLLGRQADYAISPIVCLELQFLYEIQQIKHSPRQILQHLDSAVGLEVCAKSFASVIELAEGLAWTRDPFDRIIVAQASLNLDPLITKDKRIHERYRKAVW
jgi:PIN domain nuclease of toxin-antitoxin system